MALSSDSSGGFWSALIGAASDTMQNVGYRYLDQNISKHNTSYSANKSLANSTALTAFQSQVNRQDYKWQKALDYYYDENQYYDLARKYSENSAKWNVTGLRNAGLNPILAATDGNFASTYGSGSSGGSMPSNGASQNVGFSNSHGSVTPVTESIRDFASAALSQSSAKLNSVNSDVASQTAPATVKLADANVKRVQAETDQIAANTARTLADIENDRARLLNDSFGVGVSFGSKENGSSSFRVGGHAVKSAYDSLHARGQAVKSAFDKVMNFISNGSSRSDHSSKSVEQRSPASDNSSARSQSESDKHEVRFTVHGVPYFVPRKAVENVTPKSKRKNTGLLLFR